MRVLILGGQGMLGHKLFETLQAQFEVFATFRSSRGPWRTFPMYVDHTRTIENVDAQRFDTVVEAVAAVRPHVVVNCVGIIKQLDKETSLSDMIAVNALFPQRLYGLCRASAARLLQIGTDCVFSGARGDYDERDMPDPVDAYGRTKLLGEVYGPNALTIRTSMIGRDFLKDAGLLEWFLSNRGGRIKGYGRAVFSGLTTKALSRVIAYVIADCPDLSGVYHVASQPISKLALLQRIREALDLNVEIVPEEQFYCDRSLDPTRFLQATSYSIPEWAQMIAELKDEMVVYERWREEYGSSG